jgi:predicted ribosomally synthesized peptide with SipW-like signal peptide
MKLNGKIVSALALVTLGAAIGGAGTLAKYTSQVEVGSSKPVWQNISLIKQGHLICLQRAMQDVTARFS